jgi:type II secretory pathway pseudopilin PulG
MPPIDAMKTNQTVTSDEWRVKGAGWRAVQGGCDAPVAVQCDSDAIVAVSGVGESVVGREDCGGGAAATFLRRGVAATRAFTLLEVLVVVVLLSFIVLSLMAVFNGTQAAFRASITQADVLEGGRSVMGLVKGDLEIMTPSLGQSNVVLTGGYYDFIPSNAPVNFCVLANYWQYQSNAAPLVQSLIGAGSTATGRTNVLEKFFILTRQNTTWTGVGYVVDPASTAFLNPLYRFTASANVSAPNMPWGLYTNFLAATVLPVAAANPGLSHLVDGVMHLTVRAYDINGRWMTNTYVYDTNNYASSGTNWYGPNRNVWFAPLTLGESGCYMFSNTLPAAVDIELGVLEDRAIQRAESLPDNAPAWARSNYLAQQAAKIHLFRQRIPIRNVDPSAHQ